MQKFCIDSKFLGTSRHIVSDLACYTWTDSVPRDSWHLTGEIKTTPTSKCLDTLFRLVGHKPPNPPEKYVTAMQSVISGSFSVPWQHVMPQSEFKIFFKKILQETTDKFSELPFDYYNIAWTAGNRVLASLKPAKVNSEFLNSCLGNNIQNVPVLESFKPKRSGFTKSVAYDRFATRTGRLIVSEGPNILVLKKDCRASIVSSFERGSIVSLDFRALEPRIVLYEAGRFSDSDDLYEDVSKNILGGTVQRDTVKVAVIAELYGISRSSLRTKLDVSDKQLDSFIQLIRHHFGIDNLKARLKKEVSLTGRIKNKFGRPLEIPAGQDNLLVNTYAQSTGVDVAMLGFDAILNKLGTDGIRPLFVLHDAIILDVREDRLCDVSSLRDVSVPTYDRPFLLKCEFIDHKGK